MANDEKKQDLRSGVHRRLGDWLHMAMTVRMIMILLYGAGGVPGRG